jgi:uncharacterized protein (DUF1810 family)
MTAFPEDMPTQRGRTVSATEDPFDLQRFLDAQTGSYSDALAELRQGRKRTHWMWFIFPQLDGLGSSPTARFYAIRSHDEATGYLAHPMLGPRLRECSEALLAWRGRSISDILGFPDDLKLRSSMTLFASMEGADPVFARVLDCHFKGERDPKTLELLVKLASLVD